MSQIAFTYRAVDQRGAITRGQVHAADQHEAYRQIVAAGLKPVRIVTGAGGMLTWRRSQRITTRDLSHFTHQFAVLNEARIPLVDGLRSIAEQETNDRLRDILEDVARGIEGGNSVTESLSPHRRVFGDVYLESIRAAESSGNMNEILNLLAAMLDRQYETNKEVKSALLYPLCVVGTLLLAVVFLMVFVVPRFAAMFASRGVELPLPTQMVLGISNVLQGYWYIIAVLITAGIVALVKAWRHPVWRCRIDRWLHGVPLLRDMLRGLAISRFAHVFGISLRSGLGLIDALEMSGKASGRPMLEADCKKMQSQVNQGGRLTDVLNMCRYFPPFTKRMLAAGEEAAEMSRMCEVVANHYDREVKHLSKNVTTVIEPVMIIGLSVIVLIIGLAIFLPLWNMASLIG